MAKSTTEHIGVVRKRNALRHGCTTKTAILIHAIYLQICRRDMDESWVEYFPSVLIDVFRAEILWMVSDRHDFTFYFIYSRSKSNFGIISESDGVRRVGKLQPEASVYP